MTGYKQLTKKEIDLMIAKAEKSLSLIVSEFGYERAQLKNSYHRAKEHIARLKRLRAVSPK